MIKISIARLILDALSRILSVKILRKLVLDKDSVLFERVLLRKYIRIIEKSVNPFKELYDTGKYIEFNDSYNEYSVFNMCYLSDMLGKALLAVALGYYPKDKVQ